MRRMGPGSRWWLALLIATLARSPALAQRPGKMAPAALPARHPGPQGQRLPPRQQINPKAGLNLPPRALERLEDMPPDKQEQFLRNNQRFKMLPPEQQAQIRQRLEAWNKLSPQQRQDLRGRLQVWEQMTPAQRQYVQRTLLPRWQALPPERRQAILQKLHSLRDLSEPDRQAKLSDPNFTLGLSTEDRDTLTQLAHLHVGMAPDPPGM
jgi:predicted Fe-S protein YdhL (DUF1289 family)